MTDTDIYRSGPLPPPALDENATEAERDARLAWARRHLADARKALRKTDESPELKQ